MAEAISLDELAKVTISPGKATHVQDPWRHGLTLCGFRWWFHCDLGTDHYCQKCQAKLARLKRAKEEVA